MDRWIRYINKENDLARKSYAKADIAERIRSNKTFTKKFSNSELLIYHANQRGILENDPVYKKISEVEEGLRLQGLNGARSYYLTQLKKKIEKRKMHQEDYEFFYHIISKKQWTIYDRPLFLGSSRIEDK